MGTDLAPYRVLERLVRQNGDRPLRTDLESGALQEVGLPG